MSPGRIQAKFGMEVIQVIGQPWFCHQPLLITPSTVVLADSLLSNEQG